MVIFMAARVCMCSLVKIQRRKHGNSHCLLYEMRYLHGVSVALTFTGLDALRPPVISVSVAGPSAILKPSATRSATTASAGFLERAALWARHGIRDRWGAYWSAD